MKNLLLLDCFLLQESVLLCNKSFSYYKFHNKVLEREKSKDRTIYYNIHHR
jgi:hypothetical protein